MEVRLPKTGMSTNLILFTKDLRKKFLKDLKGPCCKCGVVNSFASNIISFASISRMDRYRTCKEIQERIKMEVSDES
jgi:hypothetical protein